MSVDSVSSKAFLRAVLLGDLKFLKGVVSELTTEDGQPFPFTDVKDKNSFAALHYAALTGRKNICKYLIEELKFDVDMKDGKDETALHHAADLESIPVVTYLLEKGANPNAAANDIKLTALHYAAKRGCKELLHLLIAKGAVVDAEARVGTPLHLALTRRDKEAVKILLDKGANPNKLINHSFSPLKTSLLLKEYECAKLLLEAGADPNLESFGIAALQIAVIEGPTDIIECLVNAGANPNVNDFLGLTPIEVAASRSNHDAVKILFPKTSPNPNIIDWSPRGIIWHCNCNQVKEQREIKRKEHVLSSRSKGNDAFSKKEYQQAICWYSEALKYDPGDFAALSNRSLCSAILKDGGRALLDAQACIVSKPDWHKAYYREGVAWKLLNEYHEAAKSFRKGLKINPRNKELQTALREVEQIQQPDKNPTANIDEWIDLLCLHGGK